MTCENKVTFHVATEFSTRETQVPCGRTDPWGGTAICDKCEKDPAIMRSIRQHEENVKADNDWLRSAGWGEM
jgi:hypothetical protein